MEGTGTAMSFEVQSNIQRLRKFLVTSFNIVFLGGAGVSTESGIPDFRGENGLNKAGLTIPAEIMLSHDYFLAHPDEFYNYFRKTLVLPNVQPNAAHLKLAELEERGNLKAVITQNIDGLHQKAGSRNVFELHGNASKFYCTECGRIYDLDILDDSLGAPLCRCGGLVRPDVVLYGEGLDQGVVSKAVAHIRRADMLIVGGTSLSVYPAAGLINYYSGDKLVIINQMPTGYDNKADLLIADKIGEVFSGL